VVSHVEHARSFSTQNFLEVALSCRSGAGTTMAVTVHGAADGPES